MLSSQSILNFCSPMPTAGSATPSSKMSDCC